MLLIIQRFFHTMEKNSLLSATIRQALYHPFTPFSGLCFIVIVCEELLGCGRLSIKFPGKDDFIAYVLYLLFLKHPLLS